MHLNNKDLDKLILHYVGELAKQRHKRGLLLNYTEAVAYISSEMMDIVRMKTFFCSFGLLMAAVPVFAQNTGKATAWSGYCELA